MLDAGGGGGVPSMKGFVAAAKSGSFAVSESGGQALLSAIRDLARVVDENIADLRTANRALPLGGSNGANQMKPYMRDVLTDDQGFVTRLRQFRQSLVEAEEAINAAMANYKSTDAAAQGNFRAV